MAQELRVISSVIIQSFLLSHIKGIFGLHLTAPLSLQLVQSLRECPIVLEAGSLRSGTSMVGLVGTLFLSLEADFSLDPPSHSGKELAALWPLLPK